MTYIKYEFYSEIRNYIMHRNVQRMFHAKFPPNAGICDVISKDRKNLMIHRHKFESRSYSHRLPDFCEIP